MLVCCGHRNRSTLGGWRQYENRGANFGQPILDGALRREASDVAHRVDYCCKGVWLSMSGDGKLRVA
jgi:hypothetical protein